MTKIVFCSLLSAQFCLLSSSVVSSVYGCLQCSIDLRWPVESEEWVSDCGDAVGSIPLSLCFTFCRWNFTSLWMSSSFGSCHGFNRNGVVCNGRGSTCIYLCTYQVWAVHCLNFVPVANLDVGMYLSAFLWINCQNLYSYMNIISYRIVLYPWWTRIERASEFCAVWRRWNEHFILSNYFVMCRPKAFRYCSCRILEYKKQSHL